MSKRDPEMSSTKKNNQWYFGMKSHIGTDANSGLVHTCEVKSSKHKTRYKELEKNGSQLNMLYGLCHLYMARKALLQGRKTRG